MYFFFFSSDRETDEVDCTVSSCAQVLGSLALAAPHSASKQTEPESQRRATRETWTGAHWISPHTVRGGRHRGEIQLLQRVLW